MRAMVESTLAGHQILMSELGYIDQERQTNISTHQQRRFQDREDQEKSRSRSQ